MKILTNAWFWAAIFVAYLVVAIAFGGGESCAEGYYWEEAAGCVKR